MLRSDRLARVAASRGKYAAAACGERLASAVRGRKRSLLYVGTALALAGAGSASAATVGGSVPSPHPALATTGALSHVAAAAPAEKAVRTSTGRATAAHAAAGRPAGNHVPVLATGSKCGTRSTGKRIQQRPGMASCRSLTG